MAYFGEEDFDECGACDNCINPPAASLEPIQQESETNNLVSSDKSFTKCIDSFEIGSEVNVPKYKKGKVLAVAGDQVTVSFPDNEIRIFLSSYLEPL